MVCIVCLDNLRVFGIFVKLEEIIVIWVIFMVMLFLFFMVIFKFVCVRVVLLFMLLFIIVIFLFFFCNWWIKVVLFCGNIFVL